MGRLNLAAQRVRKRALAINRAFEKTEQPLWAKVISEFPPAQILVRQQPIQHPLSQTRTLQNGQKTQTIAAITHFQPKSVKPKRLYSPTEIKYEEDRLRKQFFSDHPWELARPRVLLETTGNQHAQANWSTGIKQPGIPFSGECAVQRQLWLLQNIPDMTVPESYDIARKEFYSVRRKEEISTRIAKEEAEMMGADYGPSAMARGMTLESKVYDEWEKWAREESIAIEAKAASFTGNSAKESKLLEDAKADDTSQGPTAPFASDSRPRARVGTRDGAAWADTSSRPPVGSTVFSSRRTISQER